MPKKVSEPDIKETLKDVSREKLIEYVLKQRDQIALLRTEAEEHTREKTSIADAFLSAQNSAAAIRTAAEKDAEKIIVAATSKAENEVKELTKQHEELVADVERMKRYAVDVFSEVKTSIEKYALIMEKEGSTLSVELEALQSNFNKGDNKYGPQEINITEIHRKTDEPNPVVIPTVVDTPTIVAVDGLLDVSGLIDENLTTSEVNNLSPITDTSVTMADLTQVSAEQHSSASDEISLDDILGVSNPEPAAAPESAVALNIPSINVDSMIPDIQAPVINQNPVPSTEVLISPDSVLPVAPTADNILNIPMVPEVPSNASTQPTASAVMDLSALITDTSTQVGQAMPNVMPPAVAPDGSLGINSNQADIVDVSDILSSGNNLSPSSRDDDVIDISALIAGAPPKM